MRGRMSRKQVPSRLTVRTVAEFNTLLSGYLKRTKMAPTTFSALATGDIRFVGAVLRGSARRVSLDKVDRVLTFMEEHPQGVQT
jgi:hypothetical protein